MDWYNDLAYNVAADDLLGVVGWATKHDAIDRRPVEHNANLLTMLHLCALAATWCQLVAEVGFYAERRKAVEFEYKVGFCFEVRIRRRVPDVGCTVKTDFQIS